MKLLIYGKAGKVQVEGNTDSFDDIFLRAFCHGIKCDDDFLEYMESDMMHWFDQEDGGYMRFEYTDFNGILDLYVIIEYHPLRRLSDSELNWLIQYTQGQMSDGIGEGFEQFECGNIEGNELYISPWFAGQKLEYIEIN